MITFNFKYKNMKRNIIVTLLIFIRITLTAQTPMALNVRIGDSELKGFVGVEYQISKYSISGGWRPGSTPAGHTTNSFDIALTLYGKSWNESSLYFSMGMASKDIVYVANINPEINVINFYSVESSMIAIIGYRSNLNEISRGLSNRFSIDVGLGYNVSKHNDLFTFEVLLNYALFKNKPNVYEFN